MTIDLASPWMPLGITRLGLHDEALLVTSEAEYPVVVSDRFENGDRIEIQFSKKPAEGDAIEPPVFCVILPDGQ